MSVLENHIRINKKLITPFNSLGSIEESDWIGVTMPNLLWISIINKFLGVKAGAELVAQTIKCLTDNQPRSLPNDLHLMGNHFKFVCTNDTLSMLKKKGLYTPLSRSLQEILILYPECPLKSSLSLSPSHLKDNQNYLAELKGLVSKLYDKTSEESTFTLVSAAYTMFVCGKLVVNSNTSLARFPEVIDYPKTEISRQIASSLRGMINIQDSKSTSVANSKRWATYFWNRSFTIEPLVL